MTKKKINIGSVATATAFGLLLASSGFFCGVSMATYTTYFDSFKQRFPEITAANEGRAKSLFGALLTGGAIPACLVVDALINRLGKRRILLGILALELCVLALHAVPSLPLLYALRAVAGFTVCAWMLFCPRMIADCLPERQAKLCAAAFGACTAAGSTIACTYHSPWLQTAAGAVLGPFLGNGKTAYVPHRPLALMVWHSLQLTWQFPVELVKFLLFLFVFRMESPAWMVGRRRKREEFYANYLQLYPHEAASTLADARVREVEQLEAADQRRARREPSGHWLAIVVAVLLTTLNQATGISFFVMYSHNIFRDNGCEPAGTFSFLFSFAGVVGGITASLVALRLSLRSMIVWGMGGQVLGLLLMIAGMAFGRTALIVGGPYVYNFSFSCAMRGVVPAYSSRIVSPRVFSYCVLLQWVLAFVVVAFALKIRAALGDLPLFLCCQTIAALGTVAAVFLVVDISAAKRSRIMQLFGEISL